MREACVILKSREDPAPAGITIKNKGFYDLRRLRRGEPPGSSSFPAGADDFPEILVQGRTWRWQGEHMLTTARPEPASAPRPPRAPPQSHAPSTHKPRTGWQHFGSESWTGADRPKHLHPGSAQRRRAPQGAHDLVARRPDRPMWRWLRARQGRFAEQIRIRGVKTLICM